MYIVNFLVKDVESHVYRKEADCFLSRKSFLSILKSWGRVADFLPTIFSFDNCRKKKQQLLKLLLIAMKIAFDNCRKNLL